MPDIAKFLHFSICVQINSLFVANIAESVGFVFGGFMDASTKHYTTVSRLLTLGIMPLPSQVLPRLVVGFRLRWIDAEAQGVSRAVLPCLTPDTSLRDFEEGLRTSGGFYTVGDPSIVSHVCRNPASATPSTGLLFIHWPSLLKSAVRLLEIDPTLALFLLSFHDILEAHSPMVADYLLRIYRAPLLRQPEWSNKALDTFLVEQQLRYLADSADRDAVVYRRTLQEECAIRYLWRANSHLSLARKYSSYEIPSPVRKYLTAAGKGSYLDLRQQFHGPAPLEAMRLLRFPLAGRSQGDLVDNTFRDDQMQVFCCASTQEPIVELWRAVRMLEAQAFFGAQEDVAKKRFAVKHGIYMQDDVVYIHWKRWMTYLNTIQKAAPLLRFAGEPADVVSSFESRSGEFVDDAAYMKIRKKIMKASRAQISPAPVSVFAAVNHRYESNYPSLMLPISDIPTDLAVSWGGDVLAFGSPTLLRHISAFKASALRSYAVRSYKKEVTFLTSGSSGEKGEKRPVSSPSNIRLLSSDDPPTVYQVYTYRVPAGSGHVMVYRHRRRTLFVPSWDMSPALKAANLSTVGTQLLTSTARNCGVHPVHPPHEVKFMPPWSVEFGYTYKFLLKYSEYPPDVDVNTVDPILRGISRLTYKEYQTQYCTRKSSKLKGYPGAWSLEEDTAIKRWYRPWMSKEERDELYKVCSSRRRTAIVARAKTLRQEMIAHGVRDIRELPHGIHNPRILEEIQHAKRSKAQRKRRKTVKLQKARKGK